MTQKEINDIEYKLMKEIEEQIGRPEEIKAIFEDIEEKHDKIKLTKVDRIKI